MIDEHQLEEKFISELVSLGYERINLTTIEAVKYNLRHQLEKFNQKANLKLNDFKFKSDNEFQIFLSEIDNRDVFSHSRTLRNKHKLNRPKSEIWLQLLDLKNPENNLFQVASQIRTTNHKTNANERYDVVILVNGLPLILIELKRSGDYQLKAAFEQTRRYRSNFDSLFYFIQLFVISDGLTTKYFSNVNTLDELNILYCFNLTDENNHRIGNLISDKDNPISFTKIFFKQTKLIEIFDKYMTFEIRGKRIKVLRSYQIHAIESIISRIDQKNKNGYVWHTTGSGKTLTAFVVTKILLHHQDVGRVLFIVDRDDLKTQTTREFSNFSNDDEKIQMQKSSKQLRKLLNKKQPLIILTTIQSLDKAIKELVKNGSEESNNRIGSQRTILIYDECHRSQFGDQHRAIKNFFKNSQAIGFTGTPIKIENSSTNQTTDQIFDKKIHSYLIKDAINDENVLKFKYEYYSNLALNAEQTTDFDNPKRQEIIAKQILQIHNNQTNNKRFNALFAVDGIKNVIRYYKLILKLIDDNPDLKLNVAAIFSNSTDNKMRNGQLDNFDKSLLQVINEYNNFYQTKVAPEDYKREIIKNFVYNRDINNSNGSRGFKIDLLIVSNMFLTGFDSAALNTLYLDKNLEYHGLIQAFSRTNRIFDGEKRFGNIISFRDLKTNLDAALKLFSDLNDLDDPKQILFEGDYNEHLNRTNSLYYNLTNNFADGSTILHSASDELKLEFLKTFRELNREYSDLKKFLEFKEKNLNFTKNDINKYKPIYFELYRQRNVSDNVNKELQDYDFQMELIEQRIIDVDYILKLLNENRPEFKQEIYNLDLTKRNITNSIKYFETEVDKTQAKWFNYMNDTYINDLKNLAIENKLEYDKLQRLYNNINFEKGVNKEDISDLLTETDFIKKNDLSERLKTEILTIYFEQQNFADKVINLEFR